MCSFGVIVELHALRKKKMSRRVWKRYTAVKRAEKQLDERNKEWYIINEIATMKVEEDVEDLRRTLGL